jgi:hypothetical protein
LAHLAKSTALVAFFGLWFTLAPIPALAQPTAPDPATTLAQRYAPVVRLVDHPDKCGRHGEQYQPTNVNAVLGNPEVALRGPWDSTNIVTVGPTAQDLSAGLPGYNLDFPGEALSPGCTYADWAAQIAETSPPTVYAHVATEPGFPDQLALQYWFFYVFNDFNDLHEGDWEMIQLNFHAADVTQALTTSPYETGYSQHEGGERAAWGDPKLQIVDGTHPVVYPALGSHANYYSDALYLGRSAAQGVGCDDTVGPSRQLRPTVINIPQAPAQYLKEFPWLGYLGRWASATRASTTGRPARTPRSGGLRHSPGRTTTGDPRVSRCRKAAGWGTSPPGSSVPPSRRDPMSSTPRSTTPRGCCSSWLCCSLCSSGWPPAPDGAPHCRSGSGVGARGER